MQIIMIFPTRNSTLGFALRTRKNLDFVKDAFENGEDVHVVTQLVLSLLGLIVVPWEHKDTKVKVQQSLKKVVLKDLTDKEWPVWDVKTGKKPKTLYQLIHKLRNAVAHSDYKFEGDPDSRLLSEVVITVSDGSYWRAEINGQDLYQFCLRFARHIEDVLGKT